MDGHLEARLCFDFKWKINDKLSLYKLCEIHLLGAFNTFPSVFKM